MLNKVLPWIFVWLFAFFRFLLFHLVFHLLSPWQFFALPPCGYFFAMHVAAKELNRRRKVSLSEIDRSNKLIDLAEKLGKTSMRCVAWCVAKASSFFQYVAFKKDLRTTGL